MLKPLLVSGPLVKPMLLDGFKYTWFQLNGRDSWERNPWVWVISFKRQTPTT